MDETSPQNAPSERQILVYGHGDKSDLGFPNPNAMIDYIATTVVKRNRNRYRYTQSKNADIIVLSREGLVFGHFEILDKTTPDANDLSEYPPVRCVYIVGKRASYQNPVRLWPLGIRVQSYGTAISEAEFAAIKNLAGDVREFPADQVGFPMPSISEIANELNNRAVDHPIGNLQKIRQELRGLSRPPTRNIFDQRTIFENYAFHVGGRQELQFNIGTEDRDGIEVIRYGVGFSLEPSQSFPDIEVLRKLVARFNEFLRVHPDEFSDLRMWCYHRDVLQTEDYVPVPIPDDRFKLGAFIF
jgi:hypothetical protein